MIVALKVCTGNVPNFLLSFSNLYPFSFVPLTSKREAQSSALKTCSVFYGSFFFKKNLHKSYLCKFWKNLHWLGDEILVEENAGENCEKDGFCHRSLHPNFSLIYNNIIILRIGYITAFCSIPSLRESDDDAHHFCCNIWDNEVLSIESAWTLWMMVEQKGAVREQWGLMHVKLLILGMTSKHKLFS